MQQRALSWRLPAATRASIKTCLFVGLVESKNKNLLITNGQFFGAFEKKLSSPIQKMSVASMSAVV